MRLTNKIIYGLFALITFIFVACQKDELDYIDKNVQPLIYITGVKENKIILTTQNVEVNKEASTIKTKFGIYRSGIQGKEAFGVDFVVDTTNLPEGTFPVKPEFITISISGSDEAVSHVDVPEGKDYAQLYLTISKSAFDAYPGKSLSFHVKLSNPSKYQLNEDLATVTFTTDEESFKNKLAFSRVTSSVTLNAEKMEIDKTAKTAIKRFSIKRTGIQWKETFGVGVLVDTLNLPIGTYGLKPGEYKLTLESGNDPISNVNFAAGEDSVQLKLTITKDVLEANSGKLLAINVILAHPTKYGLDNNLSKAAFIIDTEGFKQVAADFTSTYILNPGGSAPFQRSDAGTGQFGTLKNWKINLFIDINSPALGKRGFSTNNEVSGGYMYASRLSGETKPTEGKIYQNIALPAGKYIFEMDFKEIVCRSEVINNAYFLAVSASDTLPGTGLNNPKFPGNITDCIAYTKINYNTFPTSGTNTNYNFNYVATMPFELTTPTTVALGFIISIQNTNPYFLCRGVKLKKYVGVFD